MLREIKDGYVKAERHNGVMTVEFHHPQGNSLPGRLLEALTHEIHSAGHDQDTRVIVLRSAGERAFCAGASFDELRAIETAEQGLRFFGGFAHVIAAATGLSIVLATSAAAFAVVKYVGAAYLIYLGARMIISARRDEESGVQVPAGRGPRNPFWQGIATEILNPKTAIFFLAFIPQFVSRARGGVFWQFLLLGTISVALNTSCDLIVTILAAPIGARLRSSPVLRRRQRTATGLTLIGLGAFVAVADSK